MRHSVSKFLLPAAALLLAGAMTVAQPVLKASADVHIFERETVTTHTYPISGAFTSIEINETEADVKVVYDAKGEARVVCEEFPSQPHTVTVEGGVLKVSAYNPNIDLDIRIVYTAQGDPELTIYLPGNQYESLTFASSTGDLETSSHLTFGTLRAETSTGDLEIASKVTGTLTATASTGDIDLKNLQAANIEAAATTGSIELDRVTADGPVQLSTTTGDVELKDLTAGSLTVKTSTGDIDAEWVTINGDASLTTNTGDIELEQYTVMGNSKAESASGRVRTDWDF